MKSAVIFSVTILNKNLVDTIDEWINVFEYKFKDCDFFLE